MYNSFIKKTILMLVLILSASVSVFGKSDKLGGNEYEGRGGAKYIFLFIGDGLALPQTRSAELLAGKEMVYSTFEAQGITTTHDESALITDSASAATALATGYKTKSGVISMNADGTKSYKSLAYMAKEKGMKVGVVSSVSIDHATPACFYANQSSRSAYYDIAAQISKSGFDFFGGGDMKGNLAKKRKDNPELRSALEEAGYKVVDTKEGLASVKAGEKVFSTVKTVDKDCALHYGIDKKSEISLSEFTAEAIRILDNDDGFFIMVEGGKIDWACHQNDVMATIGDVLEFNSAVEKAVEFMKKHPKDTLIVVTGDHETGGMTVGFAGTKYSMNLDLLKNQKASQDEFVGRLNKIKEEGGDLSLTGISSLIKECYGLDNFNEYETAKLEEALEYTTSDKVREGYEYTVKYGQNYYEPVAVVLSHIMAQRAGIGWTTFSHTGVPVATYAEGIGKELFIGFYDNTDIFKKIKSIGDL